MTMEITNSKSLFDRLPEDLIQKILRDLPVKTLGRCITVDKSFASIISSPSFIYSLPCSALTSSSVSSGANDRSVVYVKCDRKDPRIRCIVSSGSSGCKEYSYPISAFGLNFAGRPKLKVVGACNGLICLREFFDNRCLLWNPLIKRSLILPDSGFDLPSCPYLTRIGLGFDSKDNDYKVLMVPYSTMPSSWNKAQRGGRDLYLYSLKSDSWTAIGSSLESLQTLDDIMTAPLVFAGGSLHFLEGSGYSSTIIAFDMRDRALRKIATPVDGRIAVRRLSISEYNGGSSIALMVAMDHWCNLWVMKEYGVEESWVELTLEDFVHLERIPWFQQRTDCMWTELPISRRFTPLEPCEYKESVYVIDEGWNCWIRTTEPMICSFHWKKEETEGYRCAASIVDSLALLDKRSTITNLP